MKPFLLFVLLANMQCTTLYAQEVNRLPGELWYSTGRFYEGSERIERDVFESRLELHPQAAPIFHSADDLTSFGNIFLVLGGSAILAGIATTDQGGINLFSDVNSEAILLSGLGASITGGILIGFGKQKLQQSIDVYNKAEFGIDRLSWQVGPNGVGICLLIGR